MLKLIKCLLFLSLVATIFPSAAVAKYDPRTLPNNHFGIHIVDENDLEDAAALVNGNGGEWGYVKLVIREDERNFIRWRNVFNNMRKLKLIPIIRIATKTEGTNWHKPSTDQIPGWVTFLDELPWPTENRYVIVGNEPNHAKEWGGSINPEAYVDYLADFSGQLKAKSDNFFVLPAGLDASAGNTKDTLDEQFFLDRMLAHRPDIADFIDGWTSHSYPNPDFSGSVTDSGRGTVKTYQWELAYLKTKGIEKDLPVFITETGWLNTTDNLEADYKEAFESVWNDPTIVAVTPFLLNYSASPFNLFSWKKDTADFYPFYYSVQELGKIAGKPKEVRYQEIKIFDILIDIKKLPTENLADARTAESSARLAQTRENKALSVLPNFDL